MYPTAYYFIGMTAELSKTAKGELIMIADSSLAEKGRAKATPEQNHRSRDWQIGCSISSTTAKSIVPSYMVLSQPRSECQFSNRGCLA
jgi:hypothetical protein